MVFEEEACSRLEESVINKQMKSMVRNPMDTSWTFTDCVNIRKS